MQNTSMPEVGDVLAGRYELVEEIGRGGFGVIFKARQKRTPQYVAIKIMSFTGSNLGPEELKQRFQREALMAGSLKHRHVVRQFDFGDDDGVFYIVMELLHGQTLGDRIQHSGPLSTALIARVGRAVLQVLRLAHSKEIVHRDLKPDNIMLCDVNGQRDFPKVLDFGAAKTTYGGHDLTSAGTALGSPAYMSPEILMGNSPVPASDLYSLGLTLGEAVVGHKVVPGATSIDRARNQISPHPIEMPKKLEKHFLFPWLQGALQKNLTLRYSSANAMLRTLNDLNITGPDATTNGTKSRKNSRPPPTPNPPPRPPSIPTPKSRSTSKSRPTPKSRPSPKSKSAGSDDETGQIFIEETTTPLISAPDSPIPEGATDPMVSTPDIPAMEGDFEVEATIVMDTDGPPLIDQSEDLELQSRRVETTDTDTDPTGTFRAPAEQKTAGLGEFDVAPTEAFDNPLYRPPAEEQAEDHDDPVAEPRPDHVAQTPPPQKAHVDLDSYGAFTKKRKAVSGELGENATSPHEIEASQETDFMTVKTSDGSQDRIFIPALVMGALLLTLVVLLIYSIAPD